MALKLQLATSRHGRKFG